MPATTTSVFRRLILLLVPLALLVAACGDDDDTSADDVEASDDTPATEDASGETIVDLAVANEDLSTLADAVTAADLAETLSGEGPFTVFAPTNEAFNSALEALGLTAEELFADTETLTTILTYHVVPSEAMSADLTDGMEVETLQGGTLTIGVTDDGVTVTDANGTTADVVTADVEASNGVVHVIDTVLQP